MTARKAARRPLPLQRTSPVEFSPEKFRALLVQRRTTTANVQHEVVAAGVRSQVYPLLKGRQPSLKLAWAIAKALRCRIEDLLKEAA
jgi:hypothetical protein